MTTYTLQRTRAAPLEFTGELLAEGTTKREDSVHDSRWHNVAIYLTTTNKIVVQIAYRSTWKNESSYDYVEVCARASEVPGVLSEYDPTECVGGWPPLPQYQARQERLLQEIEQAFDAMVAVLLAGQDAFVEKI